MIPSFYPIVDTAVCHAHGFDPAVFAEACLRGGARMIQLRYKDSASTAAFVELAERIGSHTREHGASLIVNDRPDVFTLAHASGIHVGQEDLPVPDVRMLVGQAAIVGLSTHDELQVDAALALDVTYVAVGPIFRTTTKDTQYQARGLSLVRYASQRGKPIVAIGGVTLERIRLLVDAGAAAVAVISDLFVGGDPEARTRAYLAALGSAPGRGHV